MRDLSLFVVLPVLLMINNIEYKCFELFNNSKRTSIQKSIYVFIVAYFSSALGTLVLDVTSHSFTVQSAEPDARSEPSQLKKMLTEMRQN